MAIFVVFFQEFVRSNWLLFFFFALQKGSRNLFGLFCICLRASLANLRSLQAKPTKKVYRGFAMFFLKEFFFVCFPYCFVRQACLIVHVK